MKQKTIFLVCALLASSLPHAVLAEGNVQSKSSSEAYRQMTARNDLGSVQAWAPNSASCAPDRASPVWGVGDLPIGYRCETPAQGGN